MSEYTDLRAKYIRLAKRADQRLVRLEKLSNEEYFKGVKTYAYANAVDAISKWNPGGRRFNAKIPTTEAGIRKRMKALEEFLAAPTSEKKRIKALYAKRAETINKTAGTNFTWQQLAVFFDSGLAEKMDAKLGSKTKLKAFYNMILKIDEIVEAINKSNEKDIRIDENEDDNKDEELRLDDNAAVNKKIIDLIKDNGVEFTKLLRRKEF